MGGERGNGGRKIYMHTYIYTQAKLVAISTRGIARLKPVGDP